jgi:hypothetical protein
MESLPPPLPRNPRTERLHRRDLAWQIYLPFGLALLAALVATGFAIWAGVSGQAAADSVWADVSLIFLIIIAAAIALVPLALVAGLAVGVWYILRYLPGYARVAQEYLAQAAAYVRRAADRAAAPFIAVNGAAAGVRGGWRSAVERKPKR